MKSRMIGLRLTTAALTAIRAYRDAQLIESDAEAARELVLRGLGSASKDRRGAWDAGFEQGRAEGLRLVLRACQNVIAKHAQEFGLFSEHVKFALKQVEDRASTADADGREQPT